MAARSDGVALAKGRTLEPAGGMDAAEAELFHEHGTFGLFAEHKLRELARRRGWGAVPFRTDAERRAVSDWLWSTPSRVRSIVGTMAGAGIADARMWKKGLICLEGMLWRDRNGRN